MGSGQSARRLTIDNEDTGVIKISDSVVERLIQTSDKGADEPKKVRSVTLTEPSSTTVESPQLSHSDDIPVYSGSPTHYPQLTLSALMIHQQKEQELRTQDTYWQKRLQNLEKKHAKINDIIDAEYKKAVEQLYTNDKGSVNIQDTVQPCKSSSDKVYECYQVNPKEILKCSNLVEEFYDCVDQRRARVIAARC
ncbi:MICOS complex subunit MIC25 [Anthophora quadrimaculata]